MANPFWMRTTLDGFGRVIRVESGYGASTNTQSVVDRLNLNTGLNTTFDMWYSWTNEGWLNSTM